MKKLRINSKSYFESGFTLLEVLISMSILSLMMIGVIQFTDSILEGSAKVISEDRSALQVETALSRLEWDFSQIYSPLYFSQAQNPQFMSEQEGEVYNRLARIYETNSRFAFLSYEGLPIPIFQKPDKSTLIFFTSSNRRKLANSKQSHYAWVKYSLLDSSSVENPSSQLGSKSSESTSVLVRHYLSNDIYNPRDIEWDDLKTQVLLRRIISLKFEFWNAATQKWTESLDVVKNGRHLIRGLKVNLKYLNLEDIEVETTRVFRPLFPDYVPEDMYQFLNPANSQNQGENGAENE